MLKQIFALFAFIATLWAQEPQLFLDSSPVLAPKTSQDSKQTSSQNSKSHLQNTQNAQQDSSSDSGFGFDKVKSKDLKIDDFSGTKVDSKDEESARDLLKKQANQTAKTPKNITILESQSTQGDSFKQDEKRETPKKLLSENIDENLTQTELFTPETIKIDKDDNESLLPKFAQQPKNIYLNLIDFPARTLYQGEVIAISYRLLVLSNLTSIKNELIGSDDSVRALNIDSIWKKETDGSFSNTFYFKIEAQNFTIPKIRVNALLDGKWESDESEGRSGKAIALDRNALFSKVIAKDLRLTDYKITSYDHENNLAVFRIEAENSNLEDFSLPHYQKYGTESSSISPTLSSIIYYIVAPKGDENIEFDYFSTLDYQYKRITLPNIAIDEKVSTQSDIKPKNTLRIFELLLIGTLALFFIVLYLYYRRFVLLFIAFVLFGYALYTLFVKDEGVLKVGAEVRILPTYNSTVILRPSAPLEIEILSEHGGYFKIISDDKKIGWVKKEEVEKN